MWHLQNRCACCEFLWDVWFVTFSSPSRRAYFINADLGTIDYVSIGLNNGTTISPNTYCGSINFLPEGKSIPDNCNNGVITMHQRLETLQAVLSALGSSGFGTRLLLLDATEKGYVLFLGP